MALSTKYDPLFRKHGGGIIPLAYLRALVKRESNFNPTVNSKGLMQITPIARKDWNRRNPLNQVTAAELLDPDINVMLGLDLLERTIAAYNRSGIPALRMNWDNPEFVKLLTAGWNSGPNGVRNTAKRLHSDGRPVTHASVMEAWRRNDPKSLATKGKERWQVGVASLYYQTRKSPEDSSPTNPEDPSEPEPEPEPDSGAIVLAPVDVEVPPRRKFGGVIAAIAIALTGLAGWIWSR